jgi:hypothetical protein
MPRPEETDDSPVIDEPTAPQLPDITPIELDGFRLDVHYYLVKDYEDIASASIELPAVTEWINSKLQSLTEQKLKKEDQVKELEAEAWFYLTAGGFEDLHYGGRKNAHALLMGTRLDPKVKKAKNELATLAAWCQRLYNVMTSLQAKLELVRSAEATRRRIFDSQIPNA